jgi:WD40 repeat protein
MKKELLLATLVVFTALSRNTLATSAEPAKRTPITAANASELRQLHLLGQGEINAIDWTPNGSLLVVSTTQGVWLYNAANLASEPYRLDATPTNRIAFSKDGKLLAAYGYYGPISIWDIKARKLVREVTIPNQNPEERQNRVFNVTFRPSNKLLVTIGHEIWHGFYTWDEETDTLLVDDKEAFTVDRVEVSPDQKTLLVALGELIPPQYVGVYDLTTGRLVTKLEGFESRPNDIDFNLNGSLIVSANGNVPSDYGGVSDNVVALWDGKTYKRLAAMSVDSGDRESFANSTNMVKRVAFSPRGTVIASGHGDGKVRLWDTRTHRLRLTLQTNGGIVNALAFNPDGMLLAAGTGGGKLQVWRLSDGKTHTVLNGFTGVVSPYVGPGDADSSCCLVFSGDGNVVAFGQFNGQVPIWDTNTGKRTRLLSGHTDVISSVALAADGKTMVSTGWDGTVRRWNAKTGTLLETLTLKEDETDFELASWATISPDGKYMTFIKGYNDKSLEVYQTAPLKKLVGGSLPNVIAYSDDSSLLLSGYPTGIDIWNLRENKRVAVIRHGLSGEIWSMQLSPDSKRLAIATGAGDVALIDMDKQVVTRKFNVQPVAKQEATLFPNDRGLRLGPALAIMRATGRNYIQFNRFLTRLVVTNGDDIREEGDRRIGFLNIWDIDSGKLLVRTETEHLFDTFRFSPNGEVIATGGRHFGVEVWNAETGQRLSWLHVPAEEAQIYQLQRFDFSPDSTLIGVVNGDDTITLYGIPRS